MLRAEAEAMAAEMNERTPGPFWYEVREHEGQLALGDRAAAVEGFYVKRCTGASRPPATRPRADRVAARDPGTIRRTTTRRAEEETMEETGPGPVGEGEEFPEVASAGTAEGEDQPLREEDVTREDALNDDVREGDEEDLPGDAE